MRMLMDIVDVLVDREGPIEERSQKFIRILNQITAREKMLVIEMAYIANDVPEEIGMRIYRALERFVDAKADL